MIRLIIALLVLSLVFPTPAWAATWFTTLNQAGYADDVTVTGSQTTANFFLPMPKVELQSANAVVLLLEPSPLLHPQSTFAIYFNDKQVATLTAAQLKAKPQFQAPLPIDAVQARGVNVTIRTNMYVTDDVCADYRRGHLYYILRGKSYISYNFIPPLPKTIPDFFASWYQGALIVVPDKPTVNELAAGTWVFAALQKIHSSQVVKIVTASEQAAQPVTVPRVWVALRNHLPLPLAQAQANVYLAQPQVLVITADNEEHLKDNARQVTTMPLQAALPTASSIVSFDKSARADKVSKENKDTVYFGNNRGLEGFNSVSMDFPLYPGQLQVVPRSLGIHLEGRYSPNTLSARPVRMDVLVNQNLVHSEVLDNSGVVNKDITLPATLALKARNMMSIEFRYPEDTGRCAVRGPVETAQILQSSYFTGIKTADLEAHTWDSIGMLFGRTGLILIEDNLTPDWIRAAGYMTLFMNNQLPANLFSYPEFQALSTWQQPVKAEYLAVLARAGSIPEELMARTTLRSGDGSTTYDNQSKPVLYRYEPNSNTITGQITLYKGIPTVIMAANSQPERMAVALQYLADRNNQSKFSGDVFLFADTASFYITKQTLRDTIQNNFSWVSLPWNFWEQIQRVVVEYYRWLAIGLIVIGALFAGRALAVYKGRRRNG